MTAEAEATTPCRYDLPAMDASVGHVLVVDDDPTSRGLVQGVLDSKGHTVTCAESAEDAFISMEVAQPDVILLDVMMPGMNGVTACRRIKESPQLAHIPVLIITSLDERSDRLAGIAAGANDFLHKPMDLEDMALRVRNAIYIKRLHDLVSNAYQQLKSLEDMRDTLAHMIVHDIRSSLSAMQWGLRMVLKERDPPLTEALKASQLRNLLSSTDEVLELPSSVLDVSRMETHKMPVSMERLDLVGIVKDAVESLGIAVEDNPVSVECVKESLNVQCDAKLIKRVLLNILYNAIRHSPFDGSIVIGITEGEDDIRVSITDQGPGIPPDMRAFVFEKYGQVKNAKASGTSHSSGLGLNFCKLAIEAHGGAIGVDSEPGQGSTFWFTLSNRS